MDWAWLQIVLINFWKEVVRRDNVLQLKNRVPHVMDNRHSCGVRRGQSFAQVKIKSTRKRRCMQLL